MHTFRFETRVDTSKEQAWDFLSDAKALSRLTVFPQVKTSGDTRTRAGNTIRLRVGVPPLFVSWTSWIPFVEEYVFVDVGTKVPYPFRAWCHVHRVEERESGVYFVDEVTYASFLSAFVIEAFILKPMFKQRKNAILNHFQA